MEVDKDADDDGGPLLRVPSSRRPWGLRRST